MSGTAKNTLRLIFANRVDEVMRRSANMDTQMGLAKASKIGQTTIGRILRCESPATLDTVEALAAALNVPPHELLRIREGEHAALPPEVEGLPEDAKERIRAFVDFTIREYVPRSQKPAKPAIRLAPPAKPKLGRPFEK